MTLTDTHCHLYLSEFKNDADAVMQRAADAGVTKFYLPAIDSSETDLLLEYEKKYPGKCFAMMGLHPCSVKENYKTELLHAESWLKKRRFSAIGEIGLDFYWDTRFTEQQVDAFRIQIAWAIEQNLPLSIHTRNAMRETIDLVKEYAHKGLRGIFHCFSGSYEDAREIIDAGFYLGIGGVITYKNSGLAAVIERIGTEHLVLETDAPYLAPTPFRGKRNESSYLLYIVEKLAEIKNTGSEDIAAITTANAEKIFSPKN
jgi:TatD DNase family protein